MIKVKLIPPKPVYWFSVTKDRAKNQALLSIMEELTGFKADEDLLEYMEENIKGSPFIYNSRCQIVGYYRDGSAEFEACYLFGTELRIKDE